MYNKVDYLCSVHIISIYNYELHLLYIYSIILFITPKYLKSRDTNSFQDIYKNLLNVKYIYFDYVILKYICI